MYLNGNNSLDSFGPMNLNQMETVGSTAQLNMVVQWASMQNGTTKRLLVNKDNDKNKVTSKIIQDMGPVDMGDYKNLVEFVKWGAANFPAKHYFISVWNHGNGWELRSFDNSGLPWAGLLASPSLALGGHVGLHQLESEDPLSTDPSTSLGADDTALQESGTCVPPLHPWLLTRLGRARRSSKVLL